MKFRIRFRNSSGTSVDQVLMNSAASQYSFLLNLTHICIFKSNILSKGFFRLLYPFHVYFSGESCGTSHFNENLLQSFHSIIRCDIDAYLSFFIETSIDEGLDFFSKSPIHENLCIDQFIFRSSRLICEEKHQIFFFKLQAHHL